MVEGPFAYSVIIHSTLALTPSLSRRAFLTVLAIISCYDNYSFSFPLFPAHIYIVVTPLSLRTDDTLLAGLNPVDRVCASVHSMSRISMTIMKISSLPSIDLLLHRAEGL